MPCKHINLPIRQSIRLRGYDYAESGKYFITICAKERLPLFGEIVNQNVILNQYGKIIDAIWQLLSVKHKYVKLDEYIIMPDHLHGIICINNDMKKIDVNLDHGCLDTGGSRTAPTGGFRYKSLGRLIGMFKTISTNRINLLRNCSDAVWQRNYYERIVRNERELCQIRKYIQDNPIMVHD